MVEPIAEEHAAQILVGVVLAIVGLVAAIGGVVGVGEFVWPAMEKIAATGPWKSLARKQIDDWAGAAPAPITEFPVST